MALVSRSVVSWAICKQNKQKTQIIWYPKRFYLLCQYEAALSEKKKNT